MPDEPYVTPEAGLLHLLQRYGSPEAAGESLFTRLAELEAMVEQIEAAAGTESPESTSTESDKPSEPPA